MSPDRICSWCDTPMALRRPDARTCSKRCRQARWRAKLAPADLPTSREPRLLAYADPPYPGKAHLYKDQASYAGEVDTSALLSRLSTYDGWALSTSADALPQVLALCIAHGLKVRVATWCRRPRPHNSSRILNGWEPVVFIPARTIIPPSARPNTSRPGPRAPLLQVVDTLITGPARRRPTLPAACLGMKPPAFCEWLFRLLGAMPGDALADLFPGSGIVTRTWLDYTGQASPRSDHHSRGPARQKELQA